MILVWPLLATALLAVVALAALRGGTWLHEQRVARVGKRARAWADQLGWHCQVSADGDVTLTEPDAEPPVIVRGRFGGGTLLGYLSLSTGLPLDAVERPGSLVALQTVGQHTGDAELERRVRIERVGPAALAALTPPARERLRTLIRARSTLNNNPETEPNRIESGTVFLRLKARNPQALTELAGELRTLRSELGTGEDWHAGLHHMALHDPLERTRLLAARALCEEPEAAPEAIEQLAAEASDMAVRAVAATRLGSAEHAMAVIGHADVSGDAQASLLDSLPSPWPDALIERCAATGIGPVLARAMKAAAAQGAEAEARALEDRLIALLDTPQHVDAIRALGDHGSIRAVPALHALKERLPWGQPLKHQLLDRAITAIQSRAGPREAGAVSLAVEEVGALSMTRGGRTGEQVEE